MENRRAIFVALVCFGIAMLLITAYVRVKRYTLTSDFGEEITVVVAADNIPEYSTIRPEMLKSVTVFKKFREPQTVAGKDIDQIVGKSTYVSIYKGEQITLTKLIHQDGKPVLDRQVEQRMRALTLQISPYTGVGRLVRPGNRVDILAAAHYDRDGTQTFEIKTLVQNALVLATGKNIQNEVPSRVNRDVLNVVEEEMEARRRKDLGTAGFENLNNTRPDDNYSHITVQLTPEDAEKVMYVVHTFGDQRIYFTLRNSADVAMADVGTTLLDDVLGPDSNYGASKKKLPPPSPPPKPRYYDSIGGRPVPRY